MIHETLSQLSSITPHPRKRKREVQTNRFCCLSLIVLRQVLTGMNSKSSVLRLLSAGIADGYSLQCMYICIVYSVCVHARMLVKVRDSLQESILSCYHVDPRYRTRRQTHSPAEPSCQPPSHFFPRHLSMFRWVLQPSIGMKSSYSKSMQFMANQLGVHLGSANHGRCSFLRILF